jgi:hypothetical protein
VSIDSGRLTIESGLKGRPDIRVTADAETWLGFLAGERSLLWSVLTRRIRVRGNPRWLLAFRRCFPSSPSRGRRRAH